MEEVFPPDEEYDRQCGDIFLTIKGELLIHCTLCETRFKGFEKYARHVSDLHWPESQTAIFEEFEELSAHIDAVNDEDYFWDQEEIDMMAEMAQEKLETNDFNYKTDEKEDLLNGLEGNNATKPIKSNTFHASKDIQNTHPDQCKKRVRLCPHCGYSCADRSNFAAHIRRHSQFKRHLCYECPKAFYTRSELETHMRTHTGERPYQCSQCGEGFVTSSKLNAHIKKHTSMPDKNCTHCDMKFFTYDDLNRHIYGIAHPFKCEICNETFKLKRALKSHMSVHNKRSLKCDLCSAKYKHKSSLDAHVKNSHEMIKSNKEAISTVND